MNYREMRVEEEFLAQDVARMHPWTTALGNESEQYYNFIENPELIESSLEDFIPFAHYRAIPAFYDLLRWLNGSDSIFESNDCALLREIKGSTDDNTPKIAKQTHRINGRLIFFFRDHILNGDKKAFSWLWNDLPKEFDKVAPKFDLGILGYSIAPTAYQSLPAPLSGISYPSICLTFFAWGTDDESTMENLRKLFVNTHVALKNLSKKGAGKQFPERARKLLEKVSEGDAETLNKLMTERRI